MSPRKLSKQILYFLTLPEMRLFWFSLPVLLGVLGLNLALLDYPVSLLSALILVFAAAAIFWSSFRVAQLHLDTTVEKNELKNIVYGLEDSLVLYDQNFKVYFFNPAAELLFGIKAENILDHEIKPRDVEKQELRLLAQIIFPSLAPSLVMRTQPGTYPQISDISFPEPDLELRVITTPITDSRETVLGFMKIIRNRTREVALLKSKEEFITVASHQLRTPLTELGWAFDALVNDPTLTGTPRDLVVRMNKSLRVLLALVEDLLSVAKIEEGRFGYSFEEITLPEFLEETLNTILPLAEKAQLKLYLDYPKEPLPHVMADRSKLGMVVTNLVDNAIRYNVPNGQIIVSVKKSDNSFLEVSVQDTGIGVPPPEMEKVFTKFFRSSNAVKFQTEGSGLGLYISKNIVSAHGGRMWAESEVNRGSIFHFTLPTDFSLIPQKEIAIE